MNEYNKEVYSLVERIKPLLAGKDFAIQGAALGDLVATYFAGHPPALREDLIKAWVMMMVALVPCNEREIFGPGGFPEKLQ